MRYEGKTNAEIAQILDYSLSRVTHLLSEFHKNGIEKYTQNQYKGNNRNMTYEEEEEILRQFVEAAEAGQVITAMDIKAAFDKK